MGKICSSHPAIHLKWQGQIEGPTEAEIQKTILGNSDQGWWRRFPEEKLRLLVPLDPEAQLERFEEIFGIRVRE